MTRSRTERNLCGGPRGRWPGWAVLTLTLLVVSVRGAGGQAPTEQEVQLGLEFDRAHRIHLILEELGSQGGATGSDARTVGDVVRNDLDLSDLFVLLKAPAGTGQGAPPDTNGWYRFRKSDPASVDIQINGFPTARMIAGGTLRMAGSDLLLDAWLKEYPSLRVALTRTYRARPEWFREIAHRFSDDIILYLTGEEGVARTRIAFVNNQSGSKELYITDFDGANVKQITRDRSITVSPAWSGDGQRIAFTSYRNGDPDLFQVDLTSGQITGLSSRPGPDMAPAWSRDGQRLAMSFMTAGNSEIYIADGRGRNPAQVTHSPAIDTSPSWSPTGRELCFTSDRSGDPQIYVCDSEGGNVRRLTYDGRKNDSADWSPDGTRIAYVSLQDQGFKIWSIGVNGQGNTPLTAGPGSDENPKWSPDSRKIVFTSTREGKRALYTMNADGSGVRRLTRLNGECWGTSWSQRLPR